MNIKRKENNFLFNKYLPSNFSNIILFLKKNYTICTNFFILFVVLINVWVWNFDYANFDFVLKLNYLIFLLISIVFTILFCHKYFSLSKIKIEIDFKKLLSNLSKEILDLKISNKTLLFSLLNFILFVTLISYSFLRLSSIFIFFSFFLLIKEVEQVKKWIKESKSDCIKLAELYKSEYKYIYYFSHLIKFVFFIYTCYFCIWVLFLEPTFFLNDITSFSAYTAYIQSSFHHLYFFLGLFINSALLDFAIESIITYSHYELFLQFSPASFLRRSGKFLTYMAGGAGSVGVVVAYSPAVDIPGINYFQIHYGRGYGYETSLDWTKGVILQSHLKKQVLQELVEKYGNNEKIVDGKFYAEMLDKENIVVQILKKQCTPMEQRILGLRTF